MKNFLTKFNSSKFIVQTTAFLIMMITPLFMYVASQNSNNILLIILLVLFALANLGVLLLK